MWMADSVLLTPDGDSPGSSSPKRVKRRLFPTTSHQRASKKIVVEVEKSVSKNDT